MHPQFSLSVDNISVLTAASMKVTVFWDVAPCCLVETDLRFSVLTVSIIISEIISRGGLPVLRRKLWNHQ